MNDEKEDPIFSITYRGFNAKAWYVGDSDAKVVITKEGKLFHEFLYPAYKIFNISAHFSDIVDEELSGTDRNKGYEIAGSDGLGGTVMPREIR